MPIAKAYTPSGWIASDIESPRVWDGSAWVFPTTRIWDGSGWVRNIGIAETSILISDFQVNQSASAVFILNTNKLASNNPDGRTWPWITSTASVPSGYQAYVTVISGVLDISSGIDTWVDINTTLSWGVNAFFSSNSAVINVQIRRNNGSPASASTQISLDAQSQFQPG